MNLKIPDGYIKWEGEIDDVEVIVIEYDDHPPDFSTLSAIILTLYLKHYSITYDTNSIINRWLRRHNIITENSFVFVRKGGDQNEF